MKGYTIDGEYLFPVGMYMERLLIPRPRLRRPRRKYLTDCDGTVLPLITVVCDIF